MLRISFVLGLVLVACADEAPSDGLAIAGTYTSNFDAIWGIGEAELTVDYGLPDVYAVASFDNEQRFIVAQNGEANAYNAGLWSRFDWVFVADDLYVCIQAFDAMSQDDAEATAAADASDPTVGGCGENGFAFTALTPQ